MKKTIILYGLALAVAAALMRWLEYQYAVRVLSTEIYILLVALAFTGLGAWVGYRLTQRAPVVPFRRNTQAQASLGISEREYQVLELLAEGLSNQEIAEKLFVSPNTVKTHVARLYEKLDVTRRTQAVSRARELRLVA